MFFWRCLVAMILFLLAVLVLSFAEMVSAGSFYERSESVIESLIENGLTVPGIDEGLGF